MKVRPTLVLVVLVATTIGLALPLLAASTDCEQDGGVDCCGLDCALCACCSYTSQKVLSPLGRGACGEMDGRLGPEESAKPRAPLPRDVFHVPRSALVS